MTRHAAGRPPRHHRYRGRHKRPRTWPGQAMWGMLTSLMLTP